MWEGEGAQRRSGEQNRNSVASGVGGWVGRRVQRSTKTRYLDPFYLSTSELGEGAV